MAGRNNRNLYIVLGGLGIALLLLVSIFAGAFAQFQEAEVKYALPQYGSFRCAAKSTFEFSTPKAVPAQEIGINVECSAGVADQCDVFVECDENSFKKIVWEKRQETGEVLESGVIIPLSRGVEGNANVVSTFQRDGSQWLRIKVTENVKLNQNVNIQYRDRKGIFDGSDEPVTGAEVRTGFYPLFLIGTDANGRVFTNADKPNEGCNVLLQGSEFIGEYLADVRNSTCVGLCHEGQVTNFIGYFREAGIMDQIYNYNGKDVFCQQSITGASLYSFKELETQKGLYSFPDREVAQVECCPGQTLVNSVCNDEFKFEIQSVIGRSCQLDVQCEGQGQDFVVKPGDETTEVKLGCRDNECTVIESRKVECNAFNPCPDGKLCSVDGSCKVVETQFGDLCPAGTTYLETEKSKCTNLLCHIGIGKKTTVSETACVSDNSTNTLLIVLIVLILLIGGGIAVWQLNKQGKIKLPKLKRRRR